MLSPAGRAIIAEAERQLAMTENRAEKPKSGKKFKRPGYVMFVGVDTSEEDAGYAVMPKRLYDRFEKGTLKLHQYDRFGLMYGNCEGVLTFDTFKAAMRMVEEAGGELVDVHAAIAY